MRGCRKMRNHLEDTVTILSPCSKASQNPVVKRSHHHSPVSPGLTSASVPHLIHDHNQLGVSQGWWSQAVAAIHRSGSSARRWKWQALCMQSLPGTAAPRSPVCHGGPCCTLTAHRSSLPLYHFHYLPSVRLSTPLTPSSLTVS